MVLIKHSSLVAAASGRIGSTIFQRSKSGVILRQYRRSAKSESIKSTSRKGLFRWLGVLWRSVESFVTTSSFLLNPDFSITPFSWLASGGTYSQSNGIACLTQFTGVAISYLLQFTDIFHTPNGILRFKYLGSSSVNITSVNVYIYDVVNSFTIFSYQIPDASVDFSFEQPISIYSSRYQIGFRIVGLNAIAKFEYCDYLARDNVFNLSWNQAAKNFPYTDRLGVQLTLSGQQLFTKLNLNLSELGIDPVTTAPVQSDLLGVSIASSTISPTVFQVTFNESVLPPHTAILIYCTRTFPKSVNAWKPQEMKLLRPKPEFNSGVVDCFVPFERTFGSGALISEGHVFLKVSSFDTRSGQRVKSVVQSLNIGD